jgi:sialic acid synthase SpsE
MNLMTIPDMARRFRCPIGLSDHSLNTTIDLCAAAVGARVIERHFTLSRRRRTPDSFFSAEPAEFREMVRNIRLIEEALGKVSYGPSPAEKPSRVFRRSLFAVKDIRAGETFDEENIRSIRPAGGLEPKYLNRVVGRRARTGLKAGTPLSWKAIA